MSDAATLDTLDRLVSMNTQVCLVTLDKTLIQCKRNDSYEASAVRVRSIADRIIRAKEEIRICVNL